MALKDLFDRHPRHRLLVMGTGDVFFRPGNRRTWDWAEDIELWDERILITPLAKEEWGVQEAMLAKLFEAPLYPATSDGLRALGTWFQERRHAAEGRWAAGLPTKSWRSNPFCWLTESPANVEAEWQALRPDLTSHLDEREWLRACVIHPALR